METILNLIHPIFTNKASLKWLPHIKSNTIRYQNSWDEFVITYIPNTAEFEVTVPLKDVFYKNKFNNLTSVAEYIEMHLNYYQKRT
jgi:hypothetical protein